MLQSSWNPVTREFVRKVSLVEAIILLLVALACVLMGRMTVAAYANGLGWAGFACLILAALSPMGSARLAGDLRTRAVASEMLHGPGQPARALMEHARQSVSDTAALGVAGLAAILLGELIKLLF